MNAVMKGTFAPGSKGLLSPLALWLEDKEVSEILINKPGEVWIEKRGEMISYSLPAFTERFLGNLFTMIANENEQTLNEKNPILSGSLFDGSRVQLVIPPASKAFTLSIRRKTVVDLTLADYAKSGFYDNAVAFDIHAPLEESLTDSDKELIRLYQSKDWDYFVRRAVELKKNIMVSGPTSSGKTTYLNACTTHIPHDERIITLEDTFEVDVPHQNRVQLLAPKKSKIISMQEALQCSLRLRPDRIIMGEIRGAEIMDFVAATSTGHEGSIATIHANNPRIALMRMTQLYKLNNVPSMSDKDIRSELDEVIDIIIQVHKGKAGREVASFYYKYGYIDLGQSP